MSELLLGSRDPVKAIAVKVGITNVAYIYRFFRRTYGVTPKEYRRLGSDGASPGLSTSSSAR
jgi:AraC-like DNA-binding protein